MDGRIFGRRTRCSNSMTQLNCRSSILDPKTLTRQGSLVDSSVKIGEPFSEFNLLTIDGDRSVRRSAVRFRDFREVGGVYGKEPPHPRALKLQISSHSLVVR